jgi:hypothetical protein
MKKYGILHPFWMAFYAKSLYQDVAKNWKGLGVCYLFLLVVLCTIPSIYRTSQMLTTVVQEEATPLVQQLPTLTFTEAGVSINKPTPYFIKDKKGDVVAIIDTSGKYKDLEKTKAMFLLTRTQLFFREKPEETKVFDVAAVLQKTGHLSAIQKQFVLTPNDLNQVVEKFKVYGQIATGVSQVVLRFIYRFLQVLLYAVVGLLFAALLKTRLSYGTLVRLSAVALTPTLIVGALVDHYFFLHILPRGLLFFALTMVYLFYAVYANREGA